ncbi:MAG: peptidase [Verrucomicrobiales bacterium]|nr:peptidase [Verrucomicrobiales bacterium]
MGHDINIFDGACWYVVFLFSTTVHEASHALAAYRLGDDTAYRGGQVSLDPTPHIKREPFGMVVIPIVSFILGGWMIGWASAPYDPVWAHRHPRRAGIMAMAGPASNFLLMLMAAGLIRLGIGMGWFELPQMIGSGHVVDASAGTGLPVLAATLLSITFSLNLLLFVFNLIPFPPLDGSSIPLLFLSNEGAVKYWTVLRAPAMNMIGLFVAWRLFNIVYPAIHLLVVNTMYLGLDHYGP